MKTGLLSVATFLLLRSSTTAYVSRHTNPDNHEQLVHQPAQYQELVKNLAASQEFVEIAVDDRVRTYKQSPSVEVEEDDLSDEFDENLFPSPPPTSPEVASKPSSPPPKFSLGSTSTSSPWAMVYHPYNPDGSCRTRATVHTNIENIASKGFSTIRLHNHDCSILPKLASSPLVSSNKIRLILGIHIDEEGLQAAENHVEDIISWGAQSEADSVSISAAQNHWSMVELVVVGEETIFNGHTTAPALGAFVSSTRAQFRKAGYTGPVTTTEPVHVLYESGDSLCPHLDIIASNIHPFFHAEVHAPKAGDFVEEMLELLERNVCSAEKLQAVNLETGWPWRGKANGKAVPGRDEQMTALQSILNKAGPRSTILGFGNDEWMSEGEYEVEASWDCFELFPAKN